MTPTDFRETLRLLDTALALVSRHNLDRREWLRRKLRRLGREFDLLRARLGQPPASLQRN